VDVKKGGTAVQGGQVLSKDKGDCKEKDVYSVSAGGLIFLSWERREITMGGKERHL